MSAVETGMGYESLLEEKRVLITGGSRGLGRELCLHFARQGASVAFTYLRNSELAAKTQSEIFGAGGRECLCYPVDAADEKGTRAMVEEIRREWECLDILVNNAGKSEFLPLALMEEKDWDDTLDVNLKGTYITTRAVLPQMVRRRRGRILNIGSLAGARILAAPIHYCASKAGVKGFTEALCKEVGRYRIQVNCLAPGILEGGVSRGIPEGKLRAFFTQLALPRAGAFEEVARLAAFLVSDRNSYMTGETIIIDGGL